MRTSEFACPEGTEEKLEFWGQSGNSRSCVSPIHGKWEAWSDGYKNVDGFYEKGQKHGTWFFYNPDGTVYLEIEYDMGVEVSSTKKSGD